MGIIRFLLALSVLIVHSSPLFGIEILPGYLAVQSFYIISGFYMTLIFTEKYIGSSRPKYYFFSNRLLRLYPLYLLIIVMTLAISIVYGVWLGSYGKLQYYIEAYQQHPNNLMSLVTIMFLNFSLIGQDWITFFQIDNLSGLKFTGLRGDMQMQEFLFVPIAWTVSVELFFYLLTPLIVTKNKAFILCGLLGVIFFRIFLYIAFDIGDGFGIYRFAPTELFWFLLGVLSFKLSKEKLLPDKRYGFIALFILLFSLFSYRFFKSDFLIFSLFFFCIPAVFYKFSGYKFDRYIGELAYPLYISHSFFLLIISANRFPKNLGTGLPLFVMTILFSIFCHYFFLKRIESFRITRIH